VSNVPPIVLSLILSDSIHVDHSTGKRSILGVFSAIYAREFPATHPQLVVNVELTNGHGDTAVDIKLVQVQPESVEGEMVGSARFDISFQHPRQVVGFGLGLKGVVFPQPGEYRVILECQGTILLERSLMLVHQEPHPSKQ
jgi:hypothetical protein